MKALVFGSDLITVGSLKHLVQCRAIRSLEVITPSSKKKSAPIEFCLQHNIKYHCLPKDIDFKLTNWNIPNTQRYDIGILVSFGHLIPSRIMDAFPDGMLNMHPSLLPQYVGSAPIPYCLLNGDTVTGVSIIQVSNQLDAGNILQQQTTCVRDDDTFHTLSAKLADIGGALLCDTLMNLRKYRENSIAQHGTGTVAQLEKIYAQYPSKPNTAHCPFALVKTRKIDKNLSWIDWRLPPRQIYNRHRAVNGLLRNSRCILGSADELKLLLVLIDEMSIVDVADAFEEKDAIGTIVYSKDCNALLVKCGGGGDDKEDNAQLAITKLRIAPSLSSQHLATFDKFVHEFGHFVPHCNAMQYKEYVKYMKNHF
mmetsp:Transcript_56162/g.93597  ORF Transcript_56162/g.93597 Transcript_56162/m.93597 type:complete len:367 (+) Transcript_56162:59-1159(+)